MADPVRLRSFAKINLDLRVLHKRTDEFHELRTIFQTVSLADTIHLEYQPGRTKIEVESNPIIPDNIVVRSADAILKATRKTGRVWVRLVKKIPMGGGLGGGSSNAAAMLLALPALLGKPLKLDKLLEIATELGSDVPFFLLGGTAVGLGRGTELYPLPDLPATPALIIAPGIHVSTAEAYKALDRQTAAAPQTDYAFQAESWNLTAKNWCNNFETVVFQQHPQLKSIQGQLLKLGARPARMSGSGSTLFGIFSERGLRDQAAGWFRREFSEHKNQYQIHPVTLLSRRRYQSIWRRQLGVSLASNIWPPQDRYAR
jgi:4-diphosphocytidyl-2-C-methyl-D-erythritol kinase